MPLKQGSSRKIIDKNIKTLLDEGKPLKEAIAIAYDIAKKHAEQNWKK